jgi:hypothetical protein
MSIRAAWGRSFVARKIFSEPTDMPHGTNSGASAAAGSASVRDGREFISVAETTAAYGLSRSTLYKLMGKGGFLTTTVGRRRLVHAPSFRAFVLSGAGPERASVH